MKNIYILDEYTSSTQNGIGTYLQELCGCLEFLDVSVCVIKFNSTELHFCIKTRNGIKAMHFPPFLRNGFLANYRLITLFFRLYIEDSPDNLFMFNHSPCENLLKTVKESFPLSKITFTIHDFGWASRLLGDYFLLQEIISKENGKRIRDKYLSVINYFHEEQRMYDIVDKVICLSEDTYRFLQDVYSVQKEKIRLIPNGLTDSSSSLSIAKKKSLKEKMSILPEEKIILVTGRATRAKGVISLLTAFEKVVKKYPRCRLVVIGEVYDPSATLKLSKVVATKVSYTGLISKQELSRWYQIADIGVIASFSEQCSYSGIEMMMYGLPVVASDAFGVRTMFQDGINAKIAEIGNRKRLRGYSDNLAKSLLDLLLLDELSAKLRKRSRETYKAQYASEKMRTGYENLFKELSYQEI